MREESKVEYIPYLQSSFPGHGIANDGISLPVVMASFLEFFVVLAELFIPIALLSCLANLNWLNHRYVFLSSGSWEVQDQDAIRSGVW